MNPLKRLFSRRRLYHDLSAEIRQHLEEKTEELVAAGMSRDEAVAAARREFGNLTLTEQDAREVWQWPTFENLLADIRFGVRMLGKDFTFTAVAILTLALGIGLNTAMFSILDAALLRPLPYPNPELLVKADTYDLKSGTPYGNASYLDFTDWRKTNPFLQSLAACEEKSFNLVGSAEPQHVKGEAVSSDFFETFGVQPEKGRSLANSENRQSAVLSYSLWHRSFASDPQIIGKSINLDGNSYEVVGVMPSSFQFPDSCAAARYSVGSQTELWVSINSVRPDFREEMAKRGHLGFAVIGRLQPNATLAQAQSAMETIAHRLSQQYPDADADLGVKLVPLHEDVVGKIRPALLILMGSVVLVLLIACANIGNLLLARSAVRRAEIAVRASLGASRRRIITQLVTESLLLAAAGGIAGAMLAYLLVAGLVGRLPQEISQISSVHINLSVLTFTFLVSMVSGVIFGLAPALQVSREDLNTLLKERGRSRTQRSRLSKLIVVSEVALSLVLLAAAGLLAKSLFLLNRVDPGFCTDHLLTVEVYRSISHDATPAALWKNWTGFYEQLLSRIETLPGVESAGATIALPMQERNWEVTFTIEGRTSQSLSDRPEGDVRIVSNNYFDVMKIPLKSGRYFSEEDTQESPHVAVINESLARRYWPNENPIGRVIDFRAFSAGRCQIVGVVADIRQASLSEEPPPGIYVPYTQEIMPWQTLVIRTKTDPMSLAAAIRQEVYKLDSQQPVARVATLDQLIHASTAQTQFRTMLLSGFALVALLLTAIGIYGVMAYAVSQRTHEMGLRIALGAHPSQVLSMILRQGFGLVSIGLLLGVIGALALTRLMTSLLFGTSATDPLTFVSVVFLLALVAVAACCIPARRAMRVDPLIALRYE
jgi:putative ABC transport system permease protein